MGLGIVNPFGNLDHRAPNQTHFLCFYPDRITMNGVWRGENPFDYTIPVFTFQLAIVIAATRIVSILLSPLGLPRYISETLGGFILGPSVLGTIPYFSDIVFPLRTQYFMESMSLLGLIYYTFTVGVELELPIVTRAGIRSLWFAAACSLPPFLVGALTGHLAFRSSDTPPAHSPDQLAFPIFLGATFSATAFSVLARIIAELKLAGTDVGQLTLSASLLNDTFAWGALSVATALAQTQYGLAVSAWTVLSGATICAVSFLMVRPVLIRLARRAADGEELGELRECSVLVGVMVAALLADAAGTHAIFGAFVFGLAVPNGPVGVALVEKVEDLVAGTLLPLFFAMSGFQTRTAQVKSVSSALLLMAAATAAAVMKVAAAVGVAAAFGMPLHDGTSIGLLLNCKGVIELVILNIARSKRIMSDQTFTVLVFMSVLLTSLVSPLLTRVVKPARRLAFYKRRSIGWPHAEAELRVVACLHAPRDVPQLLTLLDAAQPSKRSPLGVLALHLIELAGRASALLIINAAAPAAAPGSPTHGRSSRSRLQAQSEHIAHAFETYEQHAVGVSARTMAAISPYGSMHEDVIAAAEDRHAALVLLPFHMHMSVDGGMEVSHPAIRVMNEKVQCAAPCTVGIIVDRGLGTVHGGRYRVAAIFFGGRDDREVLAFAARMVGHPAIDLTVLRFVLKETLPAPEADAFKEGKADEASVREFLERCRDGAGSGAEFRESLVSNATEMVAELRETDASGKELFVVGKVPGATAAALTAGMSDWSECPELGAIGDFLASDDFETAASVLVLQAHGRGGGGGGSVAGGGGGGDSVLPPERREGAVRVYMDRAQLPRHNSRETAYR